MLGNAIGDALGGPVESKSAEEVRELAGESWVGGLLPYAKDHQADPFATWEPAPPRGTGTDDTRNNHLFVDCVVRNRGFVNSQLLAIEYVERYRDRALSIPGIPGACGAVSPLGM